MGRKLYRYISFEDFINLVVNSKDRFVRPSCWDDKYEGFTFSCIETELDVQRIVKEMYYNLCPRNYYAIPDNYFKLWHSKWFTYAQCWSRHSETDAMWRCYSYDNKALRIRTKEEKLLAHAKRIFPEEQNFNVYLQQVRYDLKKKSILEKQIEQLKNSLLVHEAYFHKRPVFRHEREYRLLIADNNYFGIEGMSSHGVKFKIEDNVRGMNDEEIIKYLTRKILKMRPDWNEKKNDVRIEEADDISGYVDGVMVHPLAETWYVDIIKEICSTYRIRFDGQSQIYKIKK